MKGHELIAALEREGFCVSRRSKSYTWLARGGDEVLIEVEGEIEEGLARIILEHAKHASQERPSPANDTT
jgi:hypothetical protein